jgi:Na+/H+ antiporter NhaD/arsenite permease-like protein
MQSFNWRPILGFGLIALAVLLSGAGWLQDAFAQTPTPEGEIWISGEVVDPQGQPVVEADVFAHIPGLDEPLAEAVSQEDGSFSLVLADIPSEGLLIEIERAHFNPFEYELEQSEITLLRHWGTYTLAQITMERHIGAGFWVAGLVFAAVLLIIAFEVLHSTTAALAAMSVIMVVSGVVGAFNHDWFIFSFERALTYINWEVIFLVMAMMIIIAIIEGTGVFQWTAFQAYRWSGGRSWLLVLIMMGVTAVASALLDNFTTMLLMTPISLQIGLALGFNPLALIIPEVLASNVGGISTLIGTPTNILIGAHAGIGFNDFLVNQTIGVLLALAAMGAYVLYHFRAELSTQSTETSPRLYTLLKERGQIKDPDTLLKAGIVFCLVLVGFVLGEHVHIVPAVPALAGATVLLVWLKPDVPSMIKAVDWTTLVFFMALFIVVGAIQEVGLISIIAAGMSQIVGQSLPLGLFVIVLGVGLLSTGIANIPLAASMLPVVDFLSGNIPGASSKALYYALSMGAAMGGNGLLIGAEANLVTAGITEQAGQPISFVEFLKVGLPVTFITLIIGFLWLLVRFVWFGS